MDQNTSSQPAKNSTQENESSRIAINSIHQLKQLLQHLDGLPIKPPSIYLDAAGVGQEELIDMQFLVLPTNTLYVVNMRRLGTTALFAVGDNGASLRLVLESNTIPKVGFDIRGMSRLLFRQLNVSLDGMHDLQLMELASRNNGQSKKFLAGFAKCIDQDIPTTNTAKRRWLQPDDSTNLHLFNSLRHVPRQSMKRAELFPALWTTYRRKLGVPGQAFWLRSARAESWQRVQDSKKDPGRENRQHLGPEAWWDYDQIQAAIEDWDEEIYMESQAGDWELNDEAEWVTTRNEIDWDS